MHSPKINEELIPVLYRIAKEKRKRMTKIVNEIIRKAIVKGAFRKSKNNKGNS